MTTSNRIDLFSLVHKGIRWWLGSMSAALGAADFGATGTGDLLDALDDLLATLDAHALHEDSFIAPLLQARAPERAATWDGEHRRLEQLDAALRGQVAALRAHGPSRTAGLALYRAFNRLVAEMLCHLDEEETELMPLLWRTCSDAELAAVMTGFKARYGADAASFYQRSAAAYAPPERELLGL